MKKRISRASKLAALILALSCALTACGSTGGAASSSSKGGSATGSDEPVTVTFAQKSDPTTLDAHRSYGDVGSNVLTNITEPLVAFDGDDKLYGVLAESWEATGECEWTFHLRQGVTFSNGEPFNAEAVVWNINRAMSTEYPRDSYEFTPFVEKVEAVDEYTVKFTTNKPDWTLPNQLVLVTFIAPAYSEKIGEEAISQDPVGTGPYTLTEWKRDQQIVLTARKDYWGGEPEVDQYIIKVIPETTTQIAELQTGNVDIIANVPFEMKDALENTPGVHSDYALDKRVPFVAFNTLDWSPSPELQNPLVRQAIGYAINKEAILENFLGGYGEIMQSVYRPDFPAYDASICNFEYNPEKAKELLAQAGYPDGFSVTMQACGNGSVLKGTEVAQAIAKDLQAVGIQCEVEALDYNAMRSYIIGGQEQQKVSGLYLWSWVSSSESFESHVTGYLTSQGQSCFNGIDGYDELGEKILNAHTQEEQNQYLVELQHKLFEDPAVIALYKQGMIYGISDKIEWNHSPNYTRIRAIDISVAE